MAVEEIDPVSGRVTTGHEWNGIKELDTPCRVACCYS
jgi:cytochrome c oxidase cbb3-type subunit 3